MRFSNLGLPFLTIFIRAATLAYANDVPQADDTKYAPMPWHLIDVWWDVGQETAFESLAVDVTIAADVPSTVNLYVAPIGLGHLGSIPFYGGIQTQADGNTRADPKLRQIGPGFLFSMWGERSLDAIRPSEGGFLQSSGHEGDFISARRPYAWKKGNYTYRLARMEKEVIDGKPFTWIGAFVYSHATDENLFVGALRFPGDKLMLDRKIANFLEMYGAQRPVADIPSTTITLGPPIINGKPMSRSSATAIYPDGVPDYADATAHDGSLLVQIGRPFPKRSQREMKLIEAKR